MKELTASFDGDKKLKMPDTQCMQRLESKIEILSYATIEPVSKFTLRTEQRQPMKKADPNSESHVWLQNRKNCKQQHVRTMASIRRELNALLIAAAEIYPCLYNIPCKEFTDK